MRKRSLLNVLHDALVMAAALCAAYGMVLLTQEIMGRIDGVAMLIFMLAVFVTSMYTEGYVWGVAASLISVLAVNFAFLSPYLAFNFTLPENLFSGLVMLARRKRCAQTFCVRSPMTCARRLPPSMGPAPRSLKIMIRWKKNRP